MFRNSTKIIFGLLIVIIISVIGFNFDTIIEGLTLKKSNNQYTSCTQPQDCNDCTTANILNNNTDSPCYWNNSISKCGSFADSGYSKTCDATGSGSGPGTGSGTSSGSESTDISNATAGKNGCYNNKTASVKTIFVPKMNSTNNVNGFKCDGSSVYQNNNTYGAWSAFDQDITTFWSSELTYSNGEYTGSVSLPVVLQNGTTSAIKGEILAIYMPGIYTENPTNIALTSYDIQGRQDNCCGNNPRTANTRNPHSWVVVGYDNNLKTWNYVDEQTTTNYNISLQSFNVSNPKPYTGYAIIVKTVGDDNSEPSNDKNSVQISSWTLYTGANTNTDTCDSGSGSGSGVPVPDTSKYTLFQTPLYLKN
jgi:hypothetical protein